MMPSTKNIGVATLLGGFILLCSYLISLKSSSFPGVANDGGEGAVAKIPVAVPDIPWLVSFLEFKGLRLTHVKVGEGDVLFEIMAQWPQGRLGPTSLSVLQPPEKAKLASVVAAFRRQASTKPRRPSKLAASLSDPLSRERQCREYRNAAAEYNDLDGGIMGNLGVKITVEKKLKLGGEAFPAAAAAAPSSTNTPLLSSSAAVEVNHFGRSAAEVTGVVRSQGWWGDKYVGRPVCDMGRCFNATRTGCDTKGGTQPLKVFWYPGLNGRADGNPCELGQCEWLHPGYSYPVQQALKLQPAAGPKGSSGQGSYTALVEVVSRAEDACVLVTDPGGVHGGGSDTPCDEFSWTDLKHWSSVDGVAGRNHVLIMPGCLMGCDSVGENNCYGSIGEAMVVSSNSWIGTVRPQFDVTLPQSTSEGLSALFKADPQPFRDGKKKKEKTVVKRAANGTAKVGNESSSSHARRRHRLFKSPRPLLKPRPLLVSFRGTTLNTNEIKWFRQRAILATQHDPQRGVVIDVKRKDMNDLSKPCDHYSSEKTWPDYVSMIRNSSFGLAPGGGGPYSFRFFEVLAGGAVPVVTQDLVLPWEFEEGHDHQDPNEQGKKRIPPWDDCVIRLSDSELFALPEVLDTLAKPGTKAFFKRRKACAAIWESLVGWPLAPDSLLAADLAAKGIDLASGAPLTTSQHSQHSHQSHQSHQRVNHQKFSSSTATQGPAPPAPLIGERAFCVGESGRVEVAHLASFQIHKRYWGDLRAKVAKAASAQRAAGAGSDFEALR